MRDCQLCHVAPLVPERDEVVVYSRLVVARVVEVEALRFHVGRAQLLALELGYVLQEALLLRHRHTPYHHHSIVEEEDFGRVDNRVDFGVLSSVM